MNKPKLENTFNYGFAIPDPYMIPEKNILDQDEDQDTEEATVEPVPPEKENSITETTSTQQKEELPISNDSLPPTIEKTIIPPYILDPFSVIMKLAILSKKNIGAKLCIHNNITYIQEQGLFQPIVRYFLKASKNDLSYLYNPIEIACSYFLKKYDDIGIRIIFINARHGLNLLIEHYKQSKIIVHTLYMYYTILSNYLGSTFNNEIFIKDHISCLYTPELVQHLNAHWTKEKIILVINMFTFIDQDAKSKESIKCLDEFMSQMDTMTESFFKNLNI